MHRGRCDEMDILGWALIVLLLFWLVPAFFDAADAEAVLERRKLQPVVQAMLAERELAVTD